MCVSRSARNHRPTMPSQWLIRIIALAILVNECVAFNMTHHRRAHRHERSRHRRQYRDEAGRPFLLVGGVGSESGHWSDWSEPSPCSRTCGGGVSFQERHCNVENACSGAPKRYFSCNIEDCPEGSMDFRALQCAAYNDVEFEGQTYDWIPYTQAQNKCQLNCMPRGERFYYRHEEKVHDGTLCKDDSLDICIDGECMPVGCDRLLGSNTKEDVCRVCGGDGSTCTTTSGVLENDDFIAGYNDLLLIPEGATNIRVSESRHSDNYLAIRNKTGHYYLNGNWRIDFTRSLRFAGTIFTYSRKPFGFYAPETISAPGPTNEAIIIVLLYQGRNPGIEYTYSVPKGTVHETSPQGYGWQYGDWSSCNATCGSGFQYRDVWCALRKDASRASNDLCDPSTEPASTQHCSLGACPPSWTTGAWSPCSVTCGAKGTQSRQVYCTQDDGSGRPTLFENDSACAEAGPKPETTQTCEEAAVCPSLHVGPWKPCDHLCGDGKQKRDIHCYHKVDGKIETLPLTMCGNMIPESEKLCNLRPCEGVDWITGEWSGCEDKCGLAFETRTAYCGNQNGRPYPDSLCHSYRKPQLVRNCTYTPCASQWYASQWSACSSKCGTGVQTRRVFCATFEGDDLKKVDDSKCDPDQKYPDKQECKVEEECKGEWFYGPYTSCSKPCGGGIMTRKMMCVKNNKTVDIKECSIDTIGSTTADCNKHPCGEDEIIPVVPTQVISEEYSEECEEGDYYDYEDVTTDSFIKVDSSLNSSTIEDLIFTGKDVTEITMFTDEDEGSGGFSDDLITEKSSVLPSNESSTVISETSGSVLSSSAPISLSPELSSVAPSSISTESAPESTTLSGFITTLISEISSSSFFGSTEGPSSVPDIASSSVDSSSAGPTSEAYGSSTPGASSSGGPSSGLPDSSSSAAPTDDASSASPDDLLLSDATTSSALSSGVSSEKLVISTVSSYSSSFTTDVSSDGSPTSGSSDAVTDSSPTSSSDSSDITTPDDKTTSDSSSTDSTSTDLSSSDVTSISSTDLTLSSSSDVSSTTPDVSDPTGSSIAGSASSSDSTGSSIAGSYSSPESTVSSSSSDSVGTDAGTSGLYEATSEAATSAASSFESSSLVADASTTAIPYTTDFSSSEPITSESGSTSGDEVMSTEPPLVGSSIDARSSTLSVIESSTVGSSSFPESTTSQEGSSTLDTSTSHVSTTSDLGISSTEMTPLTSASLSSEATDKEDTSEIDKTSYTEAVFNVTTPSSIKKAVTKEQRRKCKRRSKIRKCMKSEFGCCPDNKTPAKGPFGKDCPMPKTCHESEFGCCSDDVSPAEGPNGKGCPPSHCEQTLFGCCQDGITPAEGNDFEGCPIEETTFIADCSSSEFGCCPDGILSASGPDNQGCYSCNDTEFGCCPDGQTAATGPDFFGCDIEDWSTTTTATTENVTSECDNTTYGCCPDGYTEALGPDNLGCYCSQTEFGCCPDGNTTATGPNEAGCPAACKGGEFGCCDDNVTLAHGPNKEGCCLLTRHGCCPDNVLAARGPNFEGCGCQYSPYGCCPDNQTAARGPSNEGCGCQYTTHGCCPNNYTPAAGPNFQGCPCHTFQFGCCPDGVTTAIGPHLQGCGCEDTEFGCCSDGRTPAPNASKNCSCAASKYGCCLDGETEAQGEDFEGCETKLVYRGEYCSLPKELGTCRNLTIKWYFDMQYGGCSRFWYGGCGGNGNRFSNAEECKETCVEAKGKEKCYLPKIEGPCKSYYPRWYYDKERRTCSQFIYSGCLGNANRFETREECDELCGKQEHLDACDQKVDSGPCAGNYTRWFFDKESQTCSPFQYGGCQGTQNNFLTESACKVKCLQPGKSRELDTCTQPPLEGGCHNYTERFFYDVLRKQCRPFYYGGCGGNHNNFNNLLECQQRCDPKSLPKETPIQFTTDMCFLASEPGSCTDSQIKWFYNSQDGICKQFRYTGCGGNGNRFESRNDCEYSCGNVQDVCTLPRVVGPCNGNYRQWHYDQATQSCQAFDYGGCQGNGNRFDSEEECRTRCVKTKEIVPPPAITYQDICYFSVDPGPCVKQFPAWFYDPATGSCHQFMYGGCEGNANRFTTEEQCERQCGQFKGQDACYGDKEIGQCDDSIQKYYFDTSTRSCSEFYYTGCGGNPNRFSSIDECELICLENKEPPIPRDEPSPTVNQAICNQPVEVGVCGNTHRRWYYEPRKNGCSPFIYTGCGGNLNNFDSFQECTDFCLPSPKEPSPNEIDVDESKKEHCAEIERKCSLLTQCRYGLERWVDAAGCSACRCHEPCLTSPPECPPAHSCQVELLTNPDTGYTEYRGICRPDTKPGDCPINLPRDRCEQECRKDSECPGNYKCCSNGCGTVCTAPRSEEPVTREPPRFPDSSVEAPKISNENSPYEVSQEGNYVSFNCIAQGRPSPTVTWYRNGNLLDIGSGGRYRILGNGTLQVIGLEKTDSGIYTCQASNGIEPDATREYNLTVTVPVKANITSTTQDIKAGSNVNLTCDAQGDPLPRTTWYKNNAPITPSERINVIGNVLIMRDLQVEDSGEYKCIADNGYTTAETFAKLNVQGIRIPPNCTDSPFLANCKLIIQAHYCNHKFYARFCCKSCTEAGQLPADGSFAPSRKKRFIPEKLFRIPTM